MNSASFPLSICLYLAGSPNFIQSLRSASLLHASLFFSSTKTKNIHFFTTKQSCLHSPCWFPSCLYDSGFNFLSFVVCRQVPLSLSFFLFSVCKIRARKRTTTPFLHRSVFFSLPFFLHLFPCFICAFLYLDVQLSSCSCLSFLFPLFPFSALLNLPPHLFLSSHSPSLILFLAFPAIICHCSSLIRLCSGLFLLSSSCISIATVMTLPWFCFVLLPLSSVSFGSC